MNSENKKQVCELVEKSSSPLILIPENFDIDKISGALGLYLFLKRNNKNPHIACSINVPENFLFLADKKIIEHSIQGDCLYKISFDIGNNRIKKLFYAEEKGILKIDLVAAGGLLMLGKPRVDLLKFNYDLVLVLGSPQLEFLGKIYYDNACFFSETAIVNIDSSAENKKFGSVNLIRPNSPISEILADIAYAASRDTLDSEIADLFLTGIVAETNNFQAAKIRAETFALASILLKAGANRQAVIDRLAMINFLAEENTEFYPSSKITKEIIDRINREFPWYLRLEREKLGKHGERRALSNRRIIFIAAALSAIPGLMLAERGNSPLPPFFKNSVLFLKKEELAVIESGLPLTFSEIILEKEEIISFAENEEKSDSAKNESIENSINSQDKEFAISPKVEEKYSSPEISEKISKNIVAEKKAENKIKNNSGKIGLPKKISMPLFGINTTVQEVGITAAGAMEAPGNYKTVGWFKLGVKPGEKGSAVMAGHLDTNLGKEGVFWNLNKLKIGDYVYITDEYGSKMRFRAVKSEVYSAENAPMEEIFGASNIARLNLITCDGAWDAGKKSYNKRLVVFTEYDPE